MRYKENKETYSSPQTNSYSSSTTSSYTELHLKKDGTPDKRYKENKSSSSYSATSFPKSNQTTTTPPKYSTEPGYSTTVERDANGKIKRSAAAKLAFMKQTKYPNGRPGYVVDHIIPLKKGGCDCPENMQWQTIDEAKAKDKWE